MIVEIERVYGCRRLILRPISKNVIVDGREKSVITDAQVRLVDPSELRFPLLWSKTFPIKEAHALLDLFESTGIDTII